MRKKETINKNTMTDTQKMMEAVTGYFSLRNTNEAMLIRPNSKAAIPILL
jgi:hypothetical protein